MDRRSCILVMTVITGVARHQKKGLARLMTALISPRGQSLALPQQFQSLNLTLPVRVLQLHLVFHQQPKPPRPLQELQAPHQRWLPITKLELITKWWLLELALEYRWVSWLWEDLVSWSGKNDGGDQFTKWCMGISYQHHPCTKSVHARMQDATK